MVVKLSEIADKILENYITMFILYSPQRTNNRFSQVENNMRVKYSNQSEIAISLLQTLKLIPYLRADQDRLSPSGDSNTIAVGVITNLDNIRRSA